ncbi:MAG TPA: hypothetical protein VFF59_02650 [Anaerolineae bacterium]|nr:hypothetical protein [Anaerolineae bacterium]
MSAVSAEYATHARRAAAYVAHANAQRTDGMVAILEDIGPDFHAFFSFAAALAQIAVEAMRDASHGDVELVEQRLQMIAALASIEEVS